jgi:protein AroM
MRESNYIVQGGEHILLQTGVILIGQTPRPDYEEYLKKHLPIGTQMHIKGVLDELSFESIQSLPKDHGEEVLTTLARDGRQITVAARHIHQRIPELICALEKIGADLIILLCTGEFPEYPSHVPLLLPSRILTMNAVAIAEGKRISVIVPLSEQCAQLSKRWSTAGIHPTMHVLSPFHEYLSMHDLSNEISSHTPALVVLDCMGYSEAVKEILQKEVCLPVMAARSLLGHVLEEITS